MNIDISDDTLKKKSNEKNNNINDSKNIDNKNSKGINNTLLNSTKINPAEKLIEKKNEASRLDTIEAAKKSVKNIKKPSVTLDLNTLTEDKKLENSEYNENEAINRITFTPLEEEPLLLDIFNENNNHTFFIPS